MILRKARMEDLEAVCGLYREVAEAQEKSGLHQWHWGSYPNEELIRGDIEKGDLYCVYGEFGMAMAVTISRHQEEAYGEINWLFGVRPGYFYRIAVQPQLQDNGFGSQMLQDVETVLQQIGCDSVRCDTYCDNTLAIKLFAKWGMRQAGRVHMHGRPRESICFEKRLVEECPLLPLRMHPAFRGGSLTPWGGNRLMTVYDKPIEDIPTGESLEVSCVKTLESTDDVGVSLPDLIRTYGQPFVGKYEFEAFPLLLKLIDAKDTLSVQVHPNDQYAHDNEHGKLGKTEAWLILEAPKGAQLVYGVKEGTTLEELKAACEQGSAVEDLLRKVDVQRGDVCYIPAGCVHAIGKGIMLYEIQQSSDITYRFYDWNRVDKNGKGRELHLKQALDVTDLHVQLEPRHVSGKACERVLDEKYFTLDLMDLSIQPEIRVPAICNFGMLTALDHDVELCWEDASIKVKKGESFYLPQSAPAMIVRGEGLVALSMPT
ncbi:MAG: GNAT family N-acetyltransferase [Clostridia bacterium]|nr:GNAT family N-acetyltransferase [Clostridia bacterium]